MFSLLSQGRRSTKTYRLHVCHTGQRVMLGLGWHAGQREGANQRWVATDSGLGRPTKTLSPPEIAAEVYAPVSIHQVAPQV